MYLVLITNKGSNIIEDLDTLRLVAKVISEAHAGQPVTEESVTSRAFDIIFALDEVISAGGYREDVTLAQIRVNLDMESHEEKLAQMIKASKMAQAKVRRPVRAARARHARASAPLAASTHPPTHPPPPPPPPHLAGGGEEAGQPHPRAHARAGAHGAADGRRGRRPQQHVGRARHVRRLPRRQRRAEWRRGCVAAFGVVCSRL